MNIFMHKNLLYLLLWVELNEIYKHLESWCLMPKYFKELCTNLYSFPQFTEMTPSNS